MDYNSIDDDDVEKLRLAALMTFKKKSNVPLNSLSSTSGEFCQNKFSNGNSYANLSRNNRGRFHASNRSYNQRIYTNVGFRRPTHANNNLIAIIPTDSEGDTQTNDSTSKDLSTNICSKYTHNSDGIKSTNIQNLNDEVSTKFSRLDDETGSDESEDSEAEKDGNDESDDGDVLLLGEEDEDLDDLDKLMDIMEAEIAGGDVKSTKKEKKNLKQNKNKKEKGNELKIKNKLNIKKSDEPIVINQPKIIDSKPQLNIPEEELESIKTLEEIRNSPSQCNLLKPCMSLRSPTPPNRKRSISPYNKLRKRSLSPRSPRRRSPALDRYRYSPIRSRLYRRSISPRRSPRRLSPLREKNLSPRRYSPKSRYTHRSPSPRRRRRSLSRDISPSRRRLSPLRRRSRSPLKIKSKSRSPKVRPVRRRSPSPLKKIDRSSRPVSPNIRRKDKLSEDDLLKKREKVKSVDKQIETKSMDPILEARKRKFESNKPIESTSKKIILKKTNSVQVAIQTENKVTQNEKSDPEIKPKNLHLKKKIKKISQASQAPKNISLKVKKDLETVNLQRVVKVNTCPEKTNYKKRPRIIFGNDETSEMLVDEDECNMLVEKKGKIKTNIKILPPETLEVSSTSEEELSVEEELSQSEENEVEESEKEDGQESSNCDEEYIEEEEEEEEDDDDDDVQEVQLVDEKKEPLQRNNAVDLRTELKRRRALRLNMIQLEVKKKPDSFYPARLLQSAIRGVVGSSSTNEVKRKKHSKIPELSIKTEGNSDGRRVIVMNREKNRTSNIEHPENQEDYNKLERDSYASVKQLKGKLKGKLKKVQVHLRTTGVTSDNTIQKGLKKINKRNINVTDFDQM